MPTHANSDIHLPSLEEGGWIASPEPPGVVGLECQRLEQYAREQLETIRAERRRLAQERQNADAELESRRQQQLAPETSTGSNEALRRQCAEHQFQIELLQSERDAAWAQARKARRQADTTAGELDAARLQAEARDTELQLRLATAERERDEARTRINRWRTCDDSHVDLSGPPSTRTNLTPETFGLEHTDLKLGETEPPQNPPSPSLPEQLTQLRLDCDRHDVEFTQLRQEVQSERANLNANAQALSLRERGFEQRVAKTRRELALERAIFRKEVASFHQQMETERRQLKLRDAELLCRQRTLTLQESELRELAKITEHECSRERAQLHEERLRIARLREGLRLERERQKEASEG